MSRTDAIATPREVTPQPSGELDAVRAPRYCGGARVLGGSRLA
ncbi:tRNA threonylcarbamoyladenosine dehydratase, partial [Burkholderia pseudomallei]